MSQLADLMVAMHQDGLPPDVQASNMKAFKRLFESLGEPHVDTAGNTHVHGDVLGPDSDNGHFRIGAGGDSHRPKRLPTPTRGLNVPPEHERFVQPIHLKDLLS